MSDIPNRLLPAFPVDGLPGLTKREYFAAMSLMGLRAHHGAKLDEDGDLDLFSSHAAEIAVVDADELLEALEGL